MKIREVASGLQFPEGPIAMDDGSVLLVEIAGGTLTRVTADGRVQRLVHLGGGPNGAALDPNGDVIICNNGGMVFTTLEDGTVRPGHQPPDYSGGRVCRHLPLPDRYPTNVCFGGPDMRTLYVTLSATGRLIAIDDWPVPGLRLHGAR